jgi:hypothetical protein
MSAPACFLGWIVLAAGATGAAPKPFVADPESWFRENKEPDPLKVNLQQDLSSAECGMTPEGKWLFAEVAYARSPLRYDTRFIAQLAAVVACRTDSGMPGASRSKLIALTARQTDNGVDYRHAFDFARPCGEHSILLRETRMPLDRLGRQDGLPRPFRWWIWNVETDSIRELDRPTGDGRVGEVFAYLSCAFRRTDFAVADVTIGKTGLVAVRMKARMPNVEPRAFEFNFGDFEDLNLVFPSGARSFVQLSKKSVTNAAITIRAIAIEPTLRTIWEVKGASPGGGKTFYKLVPFGDVTEPTGLIPLRGEIASELDLPPTLWHLEATTGRLVGPIPFPEESLALPYSKGSPSGDSALVSCRAPDDDSDQGWICFRTDGKQMLLRSEAMPEALLLCRPIAMNDKSLFFQFDHGDIVLYRLDFANPKTPRRLFFYWSGEFRKAD